MAWRGACRFISLRLRGCIHSHPSRPIRRVSLGIFRLLRIPRSALIRYVGRTRNIKSPFEKWEKERGLNSVPPSSQCSRSAHCRQVHCIKSQSRNVSAARSQAPPVGHHPPRGANRPPHRSSHSWPRNWHPWSCHHPGSWHRLRTHRLPCMRNPSRGRRHSVRTSGRHPAPLPLYDYGEYRDHRCHQNGPHHGNHLETRLPGLTLRRMRHSAHRFQAPPNSGPAELFPCRGMCYNRRAVERAPKQVLAQAHDEPVQSASQPAAPSQGGPTQAARTEDASRYCPVCSQRLESRRCKLICSVCGYYMSCSDYY